MSGPITAKYRLVTKTFGAYHSEIMRVLRGRRAEAAESEDAGLIVTYDYNALLKPARDLLTAHVRRTDQPHKETIESIGSYSPSTIKNKLGAKIPNAVIPVSSYGIVDELTDAQVNAAWTTAGWVITVNLTIQCVLSGTLFRLPPQQINLQSVDANPANKTFNIYVRSEFGYVTYQARTDSPPESVSVMYIGRCTTNGAGIVSKSFGTATVINTFRLSTEPVGSAIPVSGGTYDAPAKFPSTWNPA